MPSLSVLALMVILPLLLIGATLLVYRIYCNHMPRYGRRKILPVPTLRRISAKPEWVRQEIIKLKA